MRDFVFGEKASLGQFQIVNRGISEGGAHHLAVNDVAAGPQKDISTIEGDGLDYIGVK